VKPRALFFGTPEFAVPCLRALNEVAEVALVVTQPDRPAGRGMQLAAPAVKLAAQELGIEVVQPKAIRKPEFAARLRAASADVALVVAYGRILPADVLHAPRLGSLNVHASLLPALRGAGPIQWAIIRGDTRTGVCLMQMDESMDTGPVLACSSLEIGENETAGELAPRLAELGAQLVRSELVRYVQGELTARPQDHAAATMAPLLSKEQGRIDWTRPARALHALVRGTHPWPGAYAFLDRQRVKLHRTTLLAPSGAHGEPGEVLRADRHGIEVACGEGVLAIHELQPDGKRRMTAEQFIAGHRLQPGGRFTSEERDG
jgi:methionyl-tRNA formyltransferase